VKRVVLDTNVLVSALLRAAGVPGRILDTILLGELTPVFDDRIFAEYTRVLSRSRFGFDPEDVTTLLDYFQKDGLSIIAPPLNISLPDEDDLPFVEVALAAQAPLVTGNQKHFPITVVGSFALQVFTPADFLKTLELNR
jgi:putative PIN family toxin of toxin-antitoxin system